jgi:WXG100 family type VII secretion target
VSVRIKITPDQVRAVAAQFKQSSDQSQDMVNKLTAQVKGMEPDWDGVTKTQFYQQFVEWQTRMREFVVLLDGINKQLTGIANNFEEVDQRAIGQKA